MLQDIEARNREVWQGHSRSFEDVTHAIGGLGLGLLAYGYVRPNARPLGFFLLGLSTVLHVVAALYKPNPVEQVGHDLGRLGR
jgi:hypothetical protein